MVNSILGLLLKFEIKKIISAFITIFLIMFFLEGGIRSIGLPVYLYLGLFLSVLGFFLLSLQNKVRKIFIILDTRLKQEQFKEKFGIGPEDGRKFKSKYKNWLLKDADRFIISHIYKNFFNYQSQNYCLYCIFSIVPFIIIWSFSNMYMNELGALILSFSIVGCLFLLCITLAKRNIGILYKKLDSEIKQIIFEESTGYDPLEKGKFTLKYKAWLVLNE